MEVGPFSFNSHYTLLEFEYNNKVYMNNANIKSNKSYLLNNNK